MQALLGTHSLLTALSPRSVPAANRAPSLVTNLVRDTNALTSSRSGSPAPASSIAFESIFSVNYVDATKLKVNVFERVGKAFGFELKDFADAGLMARSINEIVARMKPAEIFAMEKELGLDELGVSLRDVLDAMENPGGERDRKLDAALGKQAGDSAKGQGAAVKFDDLARYST